MEEMKVIKEQTEEFGEITVVVIDGVCYFLFSEVDKVMQLGNLPKEWEIHYPTFMYQSVRDDKSWRIEDVPGVGEKQLLIEMRAVYDASRLSRNLVDWKKEGGEISVEEEKERLGAIWHFTRTVGELKWKHTDGEKLAARNELLKKAIAEITGEEIFE